MELNVNVFGLGLNIMEPVKIGAGTGRPGDLAGAECRRHDVAAGAATVASVTSVVSHTQTRI